MHVVFGSRCFGGGGFGEGGESVLLVINVLVCYYDVGRVSGGGGVRRKGLVSKIVI